MDAERLTYGQLERLSGALAARLVAAGVRPGDRVALLAEKQPLMIVAMHAVMEAGAIYVPLDVGSPAPRLVRILLSAEPCLVLAAPEATTRLDEIAALHPLPPVWSLTPDPVAGERVASTVDRAEWEETEGAPEVRVDSGSPAHLIFTSGSTGQPKGVAVTHRGVVAAVEWGLRELGTGPEDRVSCHAPLHFDQSTADVYATLAAGAELHLVPARLGLDPRALAGLIRERRLTQWCSVPAALSFMARFDVVEEGDFPDLRRVLWGGEALPVPVLRYWMERLPHVEFTNLYGPTETTISSSFYTVPAMPPEDAPPLPIGRACGGEELLVLDEGLQPVAAGEEGEICIAGVGVSAGYWRDEERTRAAFVPDPRSPQGGGRLYRTGDLGRIDADGLVHFHGRRDSQVKSRGYRIELGEVESGLASVPGVEECAVVGLEVGGIEGVALCAAFVAAEEPAELRAKVRRLLPAYMVPSRWLAVAALPRTRSGKVDRQALRDRFAGDRAMAETSR